MAEQDKHPSKRTANTPPPALNGAVIPLSSLGSASADDMRALISNHLTETKAQLDKFDAMIEHKIGLTYKLREVRKQQEEMIDAAAAPMLAKLAHSTPPAYVGRALQALHRKDRFGRHYSRIGFINKVELQQAMKEHPDSDVRDLNQLIKCVIYRGGCHQLLSLSTATLTLLFPNLFYEKGSKPSKSLRAIKALTAEGDFDFETFFKEEFSRQRNNQVTLKDIIRELESVGRFGYFDDYDCRFIPISSVGNGKRLRNEMAHEIKLAAREDIASKLLHTSEQFQSLSFKEAEIYDEILYAEKCLERTNEQRQITRDRVSEFERDLSLLDQIDQTREMKELPSIDKRGGHHGTYSLYFMDGPILYLSPKGEFEFVATNRKNEPLRIRTYPVSASVRQRAERLAGLRKGDLCTASGIPLRGDALKFAADVFEVVRHGLYLFPTGDTRKRVARLVQENATEQRGQDSQPRTYGQQYLTSLEPKQIRPGALFAGTTQWKLYVFEHVIIAESDETNNATYIVRPNSLPLLTSMSRSELLESHQDALIERVIHPGDDEASRKIWREKIDRYVQPKVQNSN